MTNVVGAVERELSAIALMDRAAAEAGSSDFGDEGLADRLQFYLGDASRNARLSAAGTVGLREMVVRQLVNRLRFQADLAAHPEILKEEIRRPIIITGLFRTGTTKLQRLLSADADHRPLLFWRLLNPAPFPGSPTEERAGRIAEAVAYTSQLAEHYPAFVAAHDWEVHGPDEEALLFWMTFGHVANACIGHMPEYLPYVRDLDQVDNYRYVHSLLQYMQWQDGRGPERPWVLKSPVHLGQLPALAEVFPDATVVECQRDPLSVAPSTARLMELFRLLFSDDVDLHGLGADVLELWSGQAARHIEQRQELALDVLDVRYEDLCADPLTVVRRIHHARGTELTAEAESRIRAWVAAHPQHAHGPNPYSLERYGYTPDSVRHAYSAYIETHFTSEGNT